MFVTHSNKDRIYVIIVYVDDIVISENHEEDITQIRAFGNGHIKAWIFISQRKYVLDILKETWCLGGKPVDTSMDPNIKIGKKRIVQQLTKEDIRG